MARKKTPTKPSPSPAAPAIGRSMADQVLARRDLIARRRAAALAKAKKKGVQLAPGRQAVGVVIAEGDSWFDYPFNDILKHLEDLHGYDVESVAHRGDRVEDMAYAPGQLDDFTRRIDKVLASGVVPRAILVSGGGNDIAGEELAVMLNHASSGIAGWNEQVVAGVIDTRLADAYVTMLSAVTRVCVARTGGRIRILLHGYAYPVPDGRGFAGGFWRLPGPWLEPGFHRKGYVVRQQNTAMMEALIDRFNTMLQALARRPDLAHVRFVDLRDTLSNGSDWKTWWANELHPKPQGFAAVTARVAAAIVGP